MTPKLLLVEDDKDFGAFTKDLLTQHEYLVEITQKGSEAILLAKKIHPDLVILDLTLPDMTGESVCQALRKEYPDLIIIILSAKSAVNEKVHGLNIGADDYVTKPFVPEEFLARINARLRHNGQQKKLTIADLALDTNKIEVTRAGKVIPLTPQEFKLLEYLMLNPGIVLSREMILNRIWEYSLDVESRVVDVYMGYLRKKIDHGFKKQLIHSVRGFGYTLKE